MAQTVVARGVDVSTFQPKTLDWSKVKAEGFSFAMLRAGYGTTKDSKFEAHYTNSRAQGFKNGAYWYGYANTVDEAHAEAKAFLKAIAGKAMEYPVAYDVESTQMRSISKAALTEVVKAFAEDIEAAGYYVCIYCSTSWFSDEMNGAALAKDYDIWLAQWTAAQPTTKCGLWQYGGETNKIRSATVAGYTIDQDYAFKDYPSIMAKAKLNNVK